MPITNNEQHPSHHPATAYSNIQQTFLKQQLATGQQTALNKTLATLSDELLLEELGLPTALFGLETDLPESLTPLMQNQSLKARYQRQRLDETYTILHTACNCIHLALALRPATQMPYSHQVLVRLQQRLTQVEVLSQQTDATLANTVGITPAIHWVRPLQHWWEQTVSKVQRLFQRIRPMASQHQQVVLQLKGIGLLVPYLNRTPHAQASLEAGVWIEVFKQVRNQHATTLQQRTPKTTEFWR
jgi:hypothetical protein